MKCYDVPKPMDSCECVCCEPKREPHIVEVNVKTEEL